MNELDKEQNLQSSSSTAVKQVQSKCLTCSDCTCEGCHGDARCNLHATDWLADIPGDIDRDIVEVHFKNTRKGFYRNSTHLPLNVGDMVAVEAQSGHDIGRVSMMGRLVRLQMKKAKLKPDYEILRVFRKAKPADLEHFQAAKAKEVDTMIRSRKIAADLKLKMKIGDVEYQGDGSKAIFYYIADERVDFRQLIKVLADVFKIRIEMKQIGARQEAGRIGGIGPCGRPLCCAGWMTNFVSVSTSAARYQDISLNPQKLAGQCAKLKCCINFEVDSYVEASKKMPSRDVVLETKDNTYYHFKTDLFKKEITYSTDKNIPANLVTLSSERVFEVIALNKNGVKPDKLSLDAEKGKAEVKAFGDILGQDSIKRFDKQKKKKNKPARNDKGDNALRNQGGQDNNGGEERKCRPQTRTQGENRQRQNSNGDRQRRFAQERGNGNAGAKPSQGRAPQASQQRRQPRGNGNRRQQQGNNNAPRQENHNDGNEQQ